MSTSTKPRDPTPAELARITHRLTVAGDALRELMELLPESVHRMAFETACSGATCNPPPEHVADAAASLARYGVHAKAKRAPVLRLAGGKA